MEEEFYFAMGIVMLAAVVIGVWWGSGVVQ